MLHYLNLTIHQSELLDLRVPSSCSAAQTLITYMAGKGVKFNQCPATTHSQPLGYWRTEECPVTGNIKIRQVVRVSKERKI